MHTSFRRLTEAVAIGCLMVATTVTPLSARTTGRSGIEGKVTDASGGTLPGVTVTISSPALQIAQMTTMSDQDGRYRFPALPVGVYKVVFELSGFKHGRSRRAAGGAWQRGDHRRRMAVGAIEETLTVTGESPGRGRPDDDGDDEPHEGADPLDSDQQDRRRSREAGARAARETAYGAGRHDLAYLRRRPGARYLSVSRRRFARGGADSRRSATTPKSPPSGVNFVGGAQVRGQSVPRLLSRPVGRRAPPEQQSRRLPAQPGDHGRHRRQPYYDTNADLGGRIVRDRVWFYMRHAAHGRQSRLGFSGGPGPDGVYFTADDEQGFNESRDRNTPPRSAASSRR